MRHFNSLIFLSLLFITTAWAQSQPPPHNPPYSPEWWAPAPTEGAPDWEVLPQMASYGEVILSKRTELGVFSNFAPTPFVFKGKIYASLEGFWQATKYPEDQYDERFNQVDIVWAYTRSEVEAMSGFEAKRAGDLASENMKKMKINWVSFEGQRMTYKEPGYSSFYFIIVEAMRAKLEQNPHIQTLLVRTDGLRLRPDHDTSPLDLKAWQYYQIWMDFRDQK